MIVFDPAALRAPLAEQAAELNGAGGASAVVVEVTRGALSARLATGVSDLGTGAVARPGQTFDAGSQAKMMTAVVVLQLAEEGRVALDGLAADWLPAAIVAGVPNAETATVRQLLAMTSGVPNYTDATNEDGLSLFAEALLENPGVTLGPDDALEIARGMPATGAPGAVFAYSNTNYLLLGAMIEAVTDAPLADVLEARIFGPMGMASTSARPFEIEDPRLSSYALDPLTGAPIDVTDAPWALRGEGGVITSTADMTAFLQALLVDGALLSPEALAAMADFSPTGSAPGAREGFGLGLVRYAFGDGPGLVGFTGGTLGTDSSSYLDAASGAIVSLAGTSAEVDSQGAAFSLAAAVATDPAWAPPGSADGGVHVASGSAAATRIARGPDGVTLTLDGASLRLDGGLCDLKAAGVRFADASVLAIGGARGEVLRVTRSEGDGAAGDNQLLGRGGDDGLHGRAGDDRLSGGRGDDTLRGRGGEDSLLGGAGVDRLIGGAGRDAMRGGDGADHFVFLRASDGRAGIDARDAIGDFTPGEDRIDLSASGDWRWIGDAPFGGVAGEVRYGGDVLQGDGDGNGIADFEVALAGRPALSADDLLL